ncbi:restriction endonuclease subunit S [Alkalicoccus urumqiensis]|uniref:Restriction endonuclease subunit S n=1 Tax=Alkalicoccus urumqiensis TaxID=1548213 RepID=A0A2P6MHB0_ALKUR|nr:restriction endonuclease subunit S [Alkalicoccus urumqiensis]PRO65653.1 restriction endonuclease subunit S [Alkalicoccus urumqiensis]
MGSKRVPEVRFDNYSDEWEEQKLKHVANFIRGSFPQPYTNPDWYDEENGQPFVQVADIGFDLKLNKDTKLHISKIAEHKSRFVEKGKVVVALQGSIEKSIGRVAVTQYPAFFDRTILIFESYKVDIDNYYFAQVIQKLFHREKERAWGATISTINKEALSDFYIGLPDINEQRKIGQFLKNLDETIALHQQELTTLKQTKQGFLQKMFPKDVERVPEVRFDGFSGEWEEIKADSIFKSVSDKNHIGLPVLSASQKEGMILRDDIGIDIKYEEKSIKTYKRVQPGQFVIHLRSFQGGFAYSNIEGITSPAYTILGFQNEDSHAYLFWKFVFTSNSFIKRLETVTYGIRDGKSISFSDFSTLKFRVPIVEEQQKIGEFFKKLDDSIAAHEKELELLQETKRGFLQKMFV